MDPSAWWLLSAKSRNVHVKRNTKKETSITIDGKELLLKPESSQPSTRSVLVRCGDTVVLVTACISHEPKAGADFSPLTVDYKERTYPAGKILAAFFKRKPDSRKRNLISRLIDRQHAPIFQKVLTPTSLSVMLPFQLIKTTTRICSADWRQLRRPVCLISHGMVRLPPFVLVASMIIRGQSHRGRTRSFDAQLVVAGRKGSPVNDWRWRKWVVSEKMVAALESCTEKNQTILWMARSFFKQNGRPKNAIHCRKVDEHILKELEAKVETS